MTGFTGGPEVVLLMGPTASGKSDLALELARNHGFEIISVDSAQVYRSQLMRDASAEN